MSEQDNGHTTTLNRPTTDSREEWETYWKQEGQTWRTEPEINVERQRYLEERRNIRPDFKQGTHPFKGIKLNRADVEWLLATHEDGRGPIDWSDETQRKRIGLDLRGADLQRINLRGLPLARISANSFLGYIGKSAPTDVAIINLEGADLGEAHLEGALLGGARLEGAELDDAHLEGAFLISAHLEEANLSKAHLEGTLLNLAHLEGTRLLQARLGGAHLFNVFFDSATRLDGVILFNKELGGAIIADVHWNDVNVAVVDWSAVSMLGDERAAIERENYHRYSNLEVRQIRLGGYLSAVRAYRQLSIVLRNQGLNEDAARFAYRAQLMQRRLFRFQTKYWQCFFSLFLDLLAGYGYKPWRSFAAYLIAIAAFAVTYFLIGRTAGPVLSPLGSVVFSMTSFHGRGFFPGGIGLDDPLTVVAALEAFVGLLIEVTFIATLTQRLFGK